MLGSFLTCPISFIALLHSTPPPSRTQPLRHLLNSYHHSSARVFLGLTEAGLFPGVTYYISLWYKRSEQSRRVAIFFSAATVAGAFGGLLAFGIEKMDGLGGLQGWQWIVSRVCAVSASDFDRFLS